MNIIVLTFVGLMFCVQMHSSSALIHVVGGKEGWEIPPNKTFYCDWAKPRVFGLNDKLVFPYREGAHNVLQVSKEDFDKCGHDKVFEQYYKGPTVVQLTKLGDYFFYSGIGTHCEIGQKLHIKVVPGLGSSGRTFHPCARRPCPRQL